MDTVPDHRAAPTPAATAVTAAEQETAGTTSKAASKAIPPASTIGREELRKQQQEENDAKWAKRLEKYNPQHVVRCMQVLGQMKEKEEQSAATKEQPTPPQLRHADSEERKYGLLAEVQGYTYCILCRKWADKMHLQAGQHCKHLAWWAGLSVMDRYKELELLKQRADEAVNIGTKPGQPRLVLQYLSHVGASQSDARGGMQASSSTAVPPKKPDCDDDSDDGRGHADAAAGSGSADGGSVRTGEGETRNVEGQPGDTRDQTHPPSGQMTLTLMAARFIQKISVCEHSDVDSIYARAAMTLKTQPWKLTLLNKGAIVARGQTVCTEGTKGWTWIVATLPLTTPPREFVLKAKNQVELEAAQELCTKCQGHETDMEDGLADIFVQDELRALLGSEAEETKAMQSNDFSVERIKLREGTSTRTLQCKRGMKAGELLDEYARYKRIRRSPARLLAVQSADHTLSEDTTYYIHRTMARGGAHDILLTMETGEVLELTIEEGMTACDVVQTWADDSKCLIYKGARVADNVPLQDLMDNQFEVREGRNATYPDSPIIRHWTAVDTDATISLAELCANGTLSQVLASMKI